MTEITEVDSIHFLSLVKSRCMNFCTITSKTKNIVVIQVELY